MHTVIVVPSQASSDGGSGTAYASRLVTGLRRLGHIADLLESDAPLIQPGVVPVIDGMLLPNMAVQLDDLVARDAVALIHHVSARAGRDMAARERIKTTERLVLSRLRRVVVTSELVAERLREDFGVASPHVVVPGAPDVPRNSGSGDAACRILSVGVFTPRKGHDRLLHALAPLRDLEWTLTIAGSARRDPVHAAGLAALIADLDLDNRVTLLPDPEQASLNALWNHADLFALATRWEGYATAVAEALRRGIPVVVTSGGDAGALVPLDAGAVCALDDAPTFSKCLRRAVFDRRLRTSMAEAAWHAGQALPSWGEQTRLFDTILRS